MKQTLVFLTAAASVLAAACLALPAEAATCTWTGATNANWSTGSNWTGAGCTASGPPTNSTLTFPSGASNLTTNNNMAANNTYTITISGSGYTLAGNAIKLGGTLTDSSASGGNTITFNMAMTAARTIAVTNAAETLTVNGVISGAFALTKSGSGTLVDSATNTYTGNTTIAAGTLQVPKDTGLGAAPGGATAGSLTFTGGTLATTATFTMSANRGMAFTSTATIDVASGTTLTYGGTAAGAGGLTLIDSGTLVLSKANTYTGATLISAGTLQLGIANAVPSGSALTDNATLNLAGFADTIGSLAGSGTVQNSSATAATLTTNGNNTSTAFTGVIKNLTGTVSLTKTGTGTLTLSGTNAYTGTTTLAAGVLSISADANLGTAPGSVTAASLTFTGGTLATTAGFTLTSNRGMTFTSTATIDVASGTTLAYGGVATGAGGLTKADTGTLTLSGTNTYTGVTTISAGVLSISKDTNLGTAPGGATAGKLTFTGGTLATTATFTLSANRGMAFTSTATIDVASGTTLTYGGIAAGAGGLTTVDSGTLTLSGTNTYTGVTTLSAGVLSISKDTNLGTAPGGATAGKLTFTGGTLATTATFTLSANRGMAFTSTGTIDVASGTTLTYGGTAAGSGGLTLIDSGTLVLSKANTYTGATLVSAGTLQLGIANAIPSGSALTDNATLNLAGFADTIGSLAGSGTVQNSSATAATLTTNGDNTSTAFTGVIKNLTGTVSLTKTGTGTLTLSGTNTYTGTTTVSAGTLAVNGAQSSSAISLNGGTLTGSGTTGAVTSTSSGGTVNPGTGSGSGVLTTGNVAWNTGTPTFSVQINGATAGTNYNQLTTAGTINVTNAKLTVALGFVPVNAQVFTILNNTGGSTITGTFSGLAQGASLAVGTATFIVSYVGGSGHSITLTAATPVVALVESVSPSATGQNPGTDLAYTVSFTNGGLRAATNQVISTAIPSSTDFKLSSATAGLGTTGLTVSITYSSDGGSTYTYTPVSAGGGAPTGYDRNVTNILWTFTGNLGTASPNNTGTVTFTARIR